MGYIVIRIDPLGHRYGDAVLAQQVGQEGQQVVLQGVHRHQQGDVQDLLDGQGRFQAADRDGVNAGEVGSLGVLRQLVEAAGWVEDVQVARPRKAVGGLQAGQVSAGWTVGATDQRDADGLVDRSICRKLISRHTHLFGDDHAETPEAVLATWEKNKLKEKGHLTQSQVMNDVPHGLPALHRSFKVQHKAALVGFDWADAIGPRLKINEELDEIEECIKSTRKAVNDGKLTPEAADLALEDEVGDLLFSMVNYARHLKVQPEIALTGATDKFIRRFTRLEELASIEGKELAEIDFETLDQFWEQVKIEENRGF